MAFPFKQRHVKLLLFHILTHRDIGVMVKLYPNMSPVLLHNSQLDHKRVRMLSNLNAQECNASNHDYLLENNMVFLFDFRLNIPVPLVLKLDSRSK